MVVFDTLKIRHLPKELSSTEKEEFLKHFGANTVKVIGSAKNVSQNVQSVAFARFETAEHAKSVMQRLHQMTILNSRLCVEYAEHEIGLGPPKCESCNVKDNTEKNVNLKAFMNRIGSWNNSIGFTQPPPAHLKYKYPKPNTATINNIAHALASVPKFYIQVLHLMNKMNLPPPFSNIPDPPNLRKRIKTGDSGSSESEMESDPESVLRNNNETAIAARKPKKRMMKRPKFIKPPLAAAGAAVKPNHATSEEVFEKVDLHRKKPIEFAVSAECLEPKPDTNSNHAEKPGSFGIIQPLTQALESLVKVAESSNAPEKPDLISEQELKSNRISPKELDILPVFKNYHPGAPSCRLYIKNLAKNVELKDLEYVFGRYKVAADSQESLFDVKLLQEGRMKGQAFVTLDNIDVAKKALEETNGFILKTKPLVVVFARSAVPKK